MKKISFVIITLLSITSSSYAQISTADAQKAVKTIDTDTTASWSRGGYTSLSLSQTSLTNWAAGGTNSVSGNALFNLFLTFKDTKNVWENTLNIGYGLLNQSETLMKTDDRIEFNSKYGRKAFDMFYYAALFNFRTQFSPGYKYPNTTDKISDFLTPGYATLALGLNYIPNKYFNAFLSPVTGRLTIVNDTTLAKSYGVEPGQHLKKEFGGYASITFAKSDFQTEFLKNFSISSKLDLFSNYLKDPQYVDVNWENLIGMKVNKYITVSLNTQLIYDHDIVLAGNDKAKIQFKEILGVGFMYKF